MISITDALNQIVRANPLLEFGFRHGLFNLTKLAAYLRPMVAARAKKDVQPTAITMALSRLGRDRARPAPEPAQFIVENVTIHSGLSARSYPRSHRLHQQLNEFYRRIHDNNDFCNLTQGMHELTVIYDSRHGSDLDHTVRTQPIYQSEGIASISVQFDENYIDVPGLLYLLLQRVALQNINLIEISSTYTEAMIFVAENDARLVFDTLFESFLTRSGSPAPAHEPRC
ncbi:hypothetical protein RSO41_05055 [Halomonas sp. I1]|uniref:hypothetical protein n=1 Tax=Halomonas sp. I1 TaxID=393536 RepID=UPI0028DE97E1|nr:hypothetical protein [Halomonas sp. I1]MDT8894015.1 hypothetical protein [Halomonas sp. I1]